MLEKSPLVWYLGGGFFVGFFTSCHLPGNLEVRVAAMALREGGGGNGGGEWDSLDSPGAVVKVSSLPSDP